MGRRTPLWACCSIACVLLAGCIVEERTFDKEFAAEHNAADDSDQDSSQDQGDGNSEMADAGATVSEECSQYCSDVVRACQDENAVYSSEATCEGVCRLLPDDPDDDLVNTVACRARHASRALITEPEFYCPAAGPGGGSDSIDCGSACEAYCLLHPQICDIEGEQILEAEECLRRCAAIPDALDFDVELHHNNDTIQCRLVHLSSATLDDLAAQEHCWHTRLTPVDGSPCANPGNDEPRCEDYCQLIQVSCTDELAVYADEDECLSACDALPKGLNRDKTEQTLGCRRYHAYSALSEPALHCAHAGPSGDGHCGVDNCESYCILAKHACQEDFDARWEDQAECREECADWDGAKPEAKYDREQAASGDTVQCRIRHAVEALAGASCDGVIEGAPCD